MADDSNDESLRAAQRDAGVDRRLDVFDNPDLRADPGLRLDLRLATRRSMPPLWRRQQKALPDCAATFRDAIRAKRAGDTATYEQCMARLVAFFTSNDAAPARSPDEVRRAFGLSVDAVFADATTAETQQRFAWLDHDATQRACNAPVDVDRIDVLADANRERQRLSASAGNNGE